MGEVGSVAWMFDRVGLLEGTKAGTFDPDEEAIEAGANEVSKSDDGSYEFFTNSDDLDAVRDVLAKRGWKISTAELSYKAKNITELNDAQKKDVEEFLIYLDNMDDTHKVHATI
ncbi:putative transcriptional regulatory protein [compost metagenome]